MDSFHEGDTEAFEVLYTRYKKPIYHYFFRQVHSKSIADELHQDVWLNIIKSSSSFTQQSSFKTWLYKVAHNRLIDHFRHSSKQPLSLVQSFDKHVEANEECTKKSESIDADNHPQNEPDRTLQEQQIGNALLKGIDTLPEAQKEVFLLHEKTGLTLQEIALITDSTFESTKSRLRYAVKKLRHHIAQSQVVN
ncbi:MAG: sigma-70 family RNA polymerase sigma factor [Gammaproteobacteria bacterium]|nr:sigma-70 family RNA polymerase sigma factor [Gammaproteobacteria bacterium]